MVDRISCYRITEKIYEGSRSIIYRGYDEKNQRPVNIKRLNKDFPTPGEIAYLKQEYRILCKLDVPGVIKAYGFEKWDNSFMIILEGSNGVPLSTHVKTKEKKTDLIEFLSIAIKITEILGEIHKQSIIHKDINPKNILYNKQTREVKIIDFGIASVLARENPEAVNPNVLEGTLPYISPEQTGRMNRPVDYRSDFYSLGVTFYELLTGYLPFEGDDPMELVHCHLARNPVPPYKLNYKIPPVLSDIVMKLMSKSAEDRYQSTFGLVSDLDKCLDLVKQKRGDREFETGLDDRSAQFIIPAKLYGREKEIITLKETFDRVAAGPTELLLVTGSAGIGKTTLVGRIYKPITEKRGYFITGKFEKEKRNIPYSSLIQLFHEFVKQLLTESEADIYEWKKKILNVLGGSGQIIIDVIPEVELIIGPQSPVQDLPPRESQNRFVLLFLEFVRVFASEEHPLAIFIDDLHWADSASLNLLEVFLTDPKTTNIFFIGAYRDSGPDDTHPLESTLTRLRESETPVLTISLEPLSLTDVTQLVSDTLKSPPAQCKPLAALCMRKTGGNPLFLKELLGFLYKDRLIAFNDQNGSWEWDIGKIEKIGITDNVVDLLTDEIRKLPQKTRDILKLASCIGSRFNLQTLSIASEKSREDTVDALWEALEDQFILPLDDLYKLAHESPHQTGSDIHCRKCWFRFSHDRIQQTVYALIPEAEKEKVHLRVGRLLLKSTPINRLEEKIFDILHQLNYGIHRITSRGRRDDLAALNLMGGKKAKTSSAYLQAQEYLEKGVALLSENSWKQHYQLTLGLHVEMAETAYLNGDFEKMQRYSQAVLENARSLSDKVEVHEIQIQSLLARNKPEEALREGLRVLKLYGERFPKIPGKRHLILGFLKTKRSLSNRSVEQLIHLPQMSDISKLPLMRIMARIVSSAYLSHPELVALSILKQINLSVKYGNSYVSPLSYIYYGMLLAGPVGDIDTGYRFGKMALALLQHIDARELKARTISIFGMFIESWKDPLANTLKTIDQGYRCALETGDLEYACWSLLFLSNHSYFLGKELGDLEGDIVSRIETAAGMKQEKALLYLGMIHQVVLNLMGKCEDPVLLAGPAFNAEEVPARYRETNDRILVFSTYLNELILGYWFGRYSRAVEKADLAKGDLDSVMGMMHVPVFYFYDSLARLAMYPAVSRKEQKKIRKIVSGNQAKMKKWARHSPANIQHKYDLVEAERHRVLGQDTEAVARFDSAVRLAKKHEFHQEEGLANELAGKFYLSRNRKKIAVLYMTEARYYYTRWGAGAKVDAFDEEYGHLLVKAEEERNARVETNPATSRDAVTSESLDLTTVLKALHTISGEIVLSQLLKKMMKIVIENAGAQKGFLLLKSNRGLRVEAEGFSDREDVEILQSVPVEDKEGLSPEIIHYTARTRESIVLNDAAADSRFSSGAYIRIANPRSILCLPLIHKDRLRGVLYLENNMTTHAFTRARVNLLKLLTSQAAISLENALLYDNLEASREEYRSLFGNLNVGVFRTGGEPPGRFLHANPAAVKIFGYNSVEAFLKINVGDVFRSPDEVDEYIELLNVQGWIKNMEIAARRKDGKAIWILLYAAVQRDEQGNIKWIDGMVEDITERKQAEVELRRYREHLEELVYERTEELHGKNEKIMSSIDYAGRIQLSILPGKDKIRPFVKQHFITWKPSETVGGDFYWFHHPGNGDSGDFLAAVVDCTGHGVPGAFMTMTANSVLNRIVGNICSDDPAKILRELNRIIRSTLGQDTRYSLSDDGLDIGLCYVKPGEKKLVYAGAKISLFCFCGKDIAEIRGNKQSIGYKRSKEDYIYTNHEIDLKGGEVFYLTSDGYLHQNNENGDKKFGKRRFMELLREIHSKPLSTQKEIVEETIARYMGTEPQRDDITVLGFQL